MWFIVAFQKLIGRRRCEIFLDMCFRAKERRRRRLPSAHLSVWTCINLNNEVVSCIKFHVIWSFKIFKHSIFIKIEIWIRHIGIKRILSGFWLLSNAKHEWTTQVCLQRFEICSRECLAAIRRFHHNYFEDFSLRVTFLFRVMRGVEEWERRQCLANSGELSHWQHMAHGRLMAQRHYSSP